ncbi:MAG: hypothetical protein AAGK02_09600 [Pseudomonadota bacterium]
MTDIMQKHEAENAAQKTRDWRKSMSDHVAFALLVYTAIQIFWTVKQLEAGGSSILPYLALVVLVAAIIPACRWFEKRWSGLTDDEAADPSFLGAFRRDAIFLWIMAIGLPVVLSGVFKVVSLTL